jgi:hypothetical protein
MAAAQAARARVMAMSEAKTAHETLCRRVEEVGRLDRRCALTAGSGRLLWLIGGPLLALVGLQYWIGLPYYLRAPIFPLLAAAALYLGWKFVVRELLKKYTTTRAALLVEEMRPDLMTRLVSAIEIYPELENPAPRFDPGLVQALVIHAQRSTQSDDFCAVIDRAPARRQLMAAAVTMAAWIAAFALDASGMSASLLSMGNAWSEVRQLVQKASGARIVIDPLSQPAYLVGSDVSIHATQRGFHENEMTFFFKAEDDQKWQSAQLTVNGSGSASHLAKSAAKTFECYFVSGRIQSDHMTVLVTERPRIVNLKVETELPLYARRAPVIEPHSDGNLREKLFGSTVTLTIESNKKLKSAILKRSSSKEPENLVVGGQYARAVLRLSNEEWLADNAPAVIQETYTLQLTDEYGFSNEDLAHASELSVVKDQPPTVALVGVPNRSSADEPHVLEQALGGISALIRAKDDYGISKVTLFYRVESLDTNAEKSKDSRARAFTLPQAEIQQLNMLHFSETGAHVGDRIVFWAEIEDAYDLEPKKGPHKVKTPIFKIAVVSQEEMFDNLVNRDTWSPVWYDELKRASLPGREVQLRSSPEGEAAAKVAAKLLNAPQMGDSVRESDQQLIQDYFNSLNVAK